MNTMTRINVPNLLVDGYMWSDMLTNLSRDKFPHTDMVKLNEDTFEIHLSVAGYHKDNINVSLDNNILTVEGEWEQRNGKVKDTSFLMHGIAKRAFKRMFPLAEYIEVTSVSLSDGILKISLSRKIPDELKPKQFKIV